MDRTASSTAAVSAAESTADSAVVGKGRSHVVQSGVAASHTPGPWAVHTDGYTIIDAETRFIVARSTSYDDPETDANARLIAAAPEAIAFAEAFIEWAEVLRKVREPKSLLPGFAAREREARAVVAKARGAA